MPWAENMILPTFLLALRMEMSAVSRNIVGHGIIDSTAQSSYYSYVQKLFDLEVYATGFPKYLQSWKFLGRLTFPPHDDD